MRLSEILKLKIHQRIGLLQSRTNKLLEILDSLENEGLAKDLDDLLTDRKLPRSKYFATIAAFFEGNGNSWSTASEISKATQLDVRAVRQMVYARYSKFFEVRGDKKKEFRQRQQGK